MTRTQTTLAALLLAFTAVGCSSSDDVEVVTADLTDLEELTGAELELVETHEAEGFVHVDFYYRAPSGELVQVDVRWDSNEATPRELVDAVAQVDPRVLENARPLDYQGESLRSDVVWPRILQEARLANERLGLDAPELDLRDAPSLPRPEAGVTADRFRIESDGGRCSDGRQGFTDCVQAL